MRGCQGAVEDDSTMPRGFRPWRLFALAFKLCGRLRAGLRDLARCCYAYEKDRPAIDVIQRERFAAPLGGRAGGDAPPIWRR